LQQRKLRAAKERELTGKHLDDVNIRVLLEELYIEGDDGEKALLPKSREEVEAELHQQCHCNIL
jgi:hypothetical protein